MPRGKRQQSTGGHRATHTPGDLRNLEKDLSQMLEEMTEAEAELSRHAEQLILRNAYLRIAVERAIDCLSGDGTHKSETIAFLKDTLQLELLTIIKLTHEAADASSHSH